LDKQRLEFELVGNIRDFSTNIKAARGDLKALGDAAKESLAQLPGGNNLSKELKDAKKQAENLIATLKKLRDAGKTNLSDATPKQRAQVTGQRIAYTTGIEAAKPSQIDSKQQVASISAVNTQLDEQRKLLKDAATAERILANAAASTRREEAAAAKAQRDRNNSLISFRYTLYDVSSSLRSGSRQLAAFAKAAFDAQIGQQQAFASVKKSLISEQDTLGTVKATQSLETLKGQLTDLSTQIPASFSELAQVATFGAQLGIESKNLGNFTDVVSKFSTVAQISAEQTALSFGRVGNILQLTSTQYGSLASAIVGVGNAGASTEKEILATTGQIGAISKQAGLTASEIVGLAGALASLRIAPEEARGVFVKTFHTIDIAVASFSENMKKGNDDLKIFADVAGKTQKEFVSLWSDKTGGGAGKVFKAFIEGLGQVDTSKALRSLGLAGVRTSKVLTALGDNATLMFKQIAIAQESGVNSDLLDKAFSTSADTIAAKLKELQNSWENLQAAFAGNQTVLDALGFLVDSLKTVNAAFTRVLDKNNFTSFAAVATLALVSVGAAILALGGFLAGSLANLFAFRTAWLSYQATMVGAQTGTLGTIASLLGLKTATASATTSVAGTSVALQGYTVATGAATIGTKVLTGALRVLGVASVIGTIATVASIIYEIATAGDAVGDSLPDALNKTNLSAEDAAKQIAQASSELEALVKNSMAAVDMLSDTQDALYNLGKSLQANKNDFSVYSKTGRENLAKLNAVISALAVQAQGDGQVLANSLQGLAASMVAAGVTSADAMYQIQNAIAETGYTATTATLDIQSLIAGLNDTTSSAGKAKTALEKLDEKLQKVFRRFDVKIGVQSALDDLGKSFAENGKKVGYSTDAYRKNFTGLEDVITSFKESSGGNLTIFANNLAALRKALIKTGVTSSVAFNLIDKAIATTGKKGKANVSEVQAILGALTGAFNEQVKKDAQTVESYMSDLTGVLRDAFDNRYGNQSAMDAITSSFNDMRKAADDAASAIKDADNSINGLKSDKSILEYQLSVAIKYNDALRAKDIRAKIAEADKKLADEQAKKVAAQETVNRSLEGNSQAAIDNRSKIRSLVQSGNDYLLSLARTGTSTDDLKKKATELAADIQSQGEALGFSSTELKKYTDAFATDFTTVLAGVPKDVTIDVITDPAIQAVKDFVAKANTALGGIKAPTIDIPGIGGGSTGGGSTDNGSGIITSGGSGGASGGSGGSTVRKTTTPPVSAALKADKAKLTDLNNQIKNLKISAGIEKSKVDAAHYVFWNIKSSQANLDKLRGLEYGYAQIQQSISLVTAQAGKLAAKISKGGYATGGYVSGPGGSKTDSIPTNLSNGEFVIQASAVKSYGVDFLNALNQSRVQQGSTIPQVVSVGSSNSMVYLSPEDRQLLRAAIDRPVNLYTDNQKIASSANAGNVILAQRGAR
jgi:TP901 family phage tail tape measure protein